MVHSSKKYVGSREVFKYPYCGTSIEDKEFLSEKICCYTIKLRQKVIKKTKSLVIYLDLILHVTGGIVPSQAIGLWILPKHPPIIRSINSDASFCKKIAIASVMQNKPDKIVFSEKQMDKLYEIALKCKDNFMSKEELIAELRGGDIRDFVAAIGFIMAFIVMLKNISDVEAFQVPPGPGVIPPPHLSWLYGNSKPDHHSGFGKKAGPRSLIITDATRNAGSEENKPSHGSLDYKEIMRELDRQSHQKKIEILIGHTKYNVIKTEPSNRAEELSTQLANQIYESIRESDTDISDIATNLGFKPENVQKIKEHVFINKHHLDRYGPEETEYKRFDPILQQALAWKRLEVGTHSQDDITWLKHECAEQFIESRFDSGYSAAHELAQKHFNGAPWEKNY